jgi:hypothetical protein
MDTESTRRGFLYGTTLAAAGWAAGAAQRSASAAEQPAESHHHHAPGEANQVVPDDPRDQFLARRKAIRLSRNGKPAWPPLP